MTGGLRRPAREAVTVPPEHFPDEVRALGVPHLGVPDRILTAEQRAERRAVVRALTPEQRATYERGSGQAFAFAQADRRRATQPPPKVSADDRFMPRAERPFWVARCEELGLLTPNLTPQQRLIRARNLATDYANELATRADEGEPVASLTDDEAKIVYYEATVIRSRQRAERDRRLAAMHEEEGVAAELALAELLLKRDAR